MRFRPFSRDPFTDVRRTISEFRSVGLAESKEFHSFSVDKKNVFEIDGESARFLFQYAPKHVDMFSRNPPAYEQHYEVFSANDSVDSAAHLSAFGSILLFLWVCDGLRGAGFVKHVCQVQLLTHAHAATPLVFQISQTSVSRKNVSDGDWSLCVTRIRSWH
jgi:hypothetical protein